MFNDFVLLIFGWTHTLGFHVASYIEPMEDYFKSRIEMPTDYDFIRNYLIAFINFYGSKTLGVISLFFHGYLFVSFLIGLLLLYQSRSKSYRYVKYQMQDFCNRQFFYKVQFLIGILNFGTNLSMYQAYRFISTIASAEVNLIVIYFFFYFVVVPNLDIVITGKIFNLKRISRKRLNNICIFLTVLIQMCGGFARSLTDVLLFIAIIYHLVYSIFFFINFGRSMKYIFKSILNLMTTPEYRIISGTTIPQKP